jgi:hypothetical protein
MHYIVDSTQYYGHVEVNYSAHKPDCRSLRRCCLHYAAMMSLGSTS